jgi:hypothetical protein
MTDTMNVKLLDKASAVGDGNVFSNLVPFRMGSFQVELSGNPSRAVVSLQALLQGGTFDTVATFDTDQGYQSGEIMMLLPLSVVTIKAKLETLTGGSNPSVSAYFAGLTG